MALPQPKRLRRSVAAIRSPKQEAEIAKKYGGRIVRGSGCGSEKGDARIEGVARIEAKSTQAKSFRVTREMIAKIDSAAVAAGEVPILEIEFLNARGKPEYSVAVMPTSALETLLDNQR